MKLFEIVETTNRGYADRVIARRNEDELRPEVIDGLRVGQCRELADDLEIWRVR